MLPRPTICSSCILVLPAVFAPLLLCSQAFVLVRDPSVRRSQARRVRVAQTHTSYRVCLVAQMGQPHERTVMV